MRFCVFTIFLCCCVAVQMSCSKNDLVESRTELSMVDNTTQHKTILDSFARSIKSKGKVKTLKKILYALKFWQSADYM